MFLQLCLLEALVQSHATSRRTAWPRTTAARRTRSGCPRWVRFLRRTTLAPSRLCDDDKNMCNQNKKKGTVFKRLCIERPPPPTRGRGGSSGIFTASGPTRLTIKPTEEPAGRWAAALIRVCAHTQLSLASGTLELLEASVASVSGLLFGGFERRDAAHSLALLPFGAPGKRGGVERGGADSQQARVGGGW